MYFLIWSVHSFYFLHHLLLSIDCRFSVGCFSDGWLFIVPWVRFLVCQTISVDPFCDRVESSETFCSHTASAEHKPILCFYVNLLSTKIHRSNWVFLGFPGGAGGKEPARQCKRYKRCGFNPWVGKIPWRRAWQPTSIFLPGESHG